MKHFWRFAVLGLVASTAQAADLLNPAQATLAMCEQGIEEWAQQFSPLSIDTAVLQPLDESSQDKRIELSVEIVYDSEGGPETRNANIACKVDSGGSVSLEEISR
jgi:hypothetical protein